MRQLAPLALAVIPLIFSVAACQVTKDNANNSVTVSYNQDVAENAAADAVAGANEAAQSIANDARKIGDEAKNLDVDVSVNNKAAGNDAAPANKQ